MTPWATTLDFGVVHPLAFLECREGGGPMLETLQTIVDDETFGAVEIAPIPDPALRARASALLQEAALQVVYLPILPIIFADLGVGSLDDARRRDAIGRLRELIDQAIEFDAPLAMVTGPQDPGPALRDAVAERLAADLRGLCDYADSRARRRRLHLTFEHFDREVEKKRMVGPTTEAVALAEAVDRSNFGLTVDLSHLPLLGESSADAIRIAAPHLIHAHIGNCVADNPRDPLLRRLPSALRPPGRPKRRARSYRIPPRIAGSRLFHAGGRAVGCDADPLDGKPAESAGPREQCHDYCQWQADVSPRVGVFLT